MLKKNSKTLDSPNIRFTEGAADPESGQELGLFIEINVNNKNRPFRGEIEVLRSLKEKNIARSSYRETFDLRHQDGFFMAGVLPQIKLARTELELLQNNSRIFRIYNNNSEFLSKESLFVLLFHINAQTQKE